MLTTTGTELDVFAHFVRDWSLPKFKKKSDGRRQHAKQMGRMDSDSDDDDEEENEEPRVGFSTLTQGFVIEGSTGMTAFRPARWLRWLVPSITVPRPALSVQDFFRSIHNSTLELAVVASRAAGYEIALMRAKQMGQTALLEQLQAGLVTMQAETQLVALGLHRYLEEQTVVAFVKQSPQGLRLDWLPNFTRLLPEDLQTLKQEADQRGCFDNYAVLHYDPTVTAYATTKAERDAAVAAKRDPILFGLMERSRKLYYVGDWVDESCTLTLQQIVDALGADSVKEL